MKFKSSVYVANKTNLQKAQKEIRMKVGEYFNVDCSRGLPWNSIKLYGEFENTFLPAATKGDEKKEWVTRHKGKEFYLQTVELSMK